MTVQYTEWRSLQTRDAVNPGPNQEVEESLLVATQHVLSFYANQRSYGEDEVSIFPAFHKGERCWVRREVWCPAWGYSASGTQETILSFEEGVKLFIQWEVFSFPVPEEVSNKKEIKQG